MGATVQATRNERLIRVVVGELITDYGWPSHINLHLLQKLHTDYLPKNPVQAGGIQTMLLRRSGTKGEMGIKT